MNANSTGVNANDRQVGGSHYAGVYQHWDLVADLRLGYFEGQVTKYVSRWRKKNGIQDLEKASHFLSKLIELVSLSGRSAATSAHGGWNGTRANGERGHSLHGLLQMYSRTNKLSPAEFGVIYRVATWNLRDQLFQAQEQLQKMIADANMLKVQMVDSGQPQGRGYVDQDREQDAVWNKLGGLRDDDYQI